MRREEQILKLEELLGLKEENQAFLDDSPSTNPVADYHDPARFEQEQTHIFSRYPKIVAHVSEIKSANSFLRRTIQGQPLLLMRGDDGEVRMFLNVCRHRGTRLVDAESGCKARHSCPYHAWTWNSRGEFVNGPHFDSGFPGVDRSALGLKPVPMAVRHGFIWLLPTADTDLDAYLAEMGAEMEWFGTESLIAHATDTQERRCNWKLLVEGGIEAYHFRVAHRNTIAQLFNDNLSSYEMLGLHMRSILPRSSITDLKDQPREDWDIRKHSNVLYTLFPGATFLVQSDHVIWLSWDPIATDRSILRMVTLVPKQSDRPKEYWDRNHAFTVETLNEDFDIAESIQSGMSSGANEFVRFGRFEGALEKFNQTVRSHLN